MGAPKASLEWHGSTLLGRVAGILTRALDGSGPVIVVRAPGQALPRLPAACAVVEDAHPGRGPLEGLAAGMRGLAGRAEVAFVTSTDAPLLHPAFVAAVLAGLRAGDEICVPVLDGVAHPLAAAYRTSVAAAITTLLAEDRLRLRLLLDRCRTHPLPKEDLLADAGLSLADPGLDSLLNLNGPGDYAAARARPAPAIRLRGREARAATLGEAAALAGRVIGPGTLATLNGRPAGDDPQLPLVAGDAVAFG